MIYGIGMDIQLVSQIKDILSRHGEYFLQRIFTKDEVVYCSNHRKPEQHYAARWAVKEACLKALGTGMARGFRLRDIETVRLVSGKPHIVLHGKIREHCLDHCLRAFVSISHSGEYAAAQVILEYWQNEDEGN